MSKTSTRIQAEQHLLSAIRYMLNGTEKKAKETVRDATRAAINILDYQNTAGQPLPRKERDNVLRMAGEINSFASDLMRATMMLEKLTQNQEKEREAE